jgi:hypothetical protein
MAKLMQTQIEQGEQLRAATTTPRSTTPDLRSASELDAMTRTVRDADVDLRRAHDAIAKLTRAIEKSRSETSTSRIETERAHELIKSLTLALQPAVFAS